VLLVDGDMRKAELSRLLGMQARHGLLDAIKSGQGVEAAIVRDGATGLHFLPAASVLDTDAATSAAEHLSHGGADQVIDRLRSQFDLVVVDAPPLLPVVDARFLADLVDQIVFVMTWKRTPKALAKRAMKLLGLNSRKVIGVVVNQVDPADFAASQGYGVTERRAPRIERRRRHELAAA
jgi:Mrp family chromosome partitioning ATPase